MRHRQQALSRLRDDHVAAKTAASNQLGALLDAHWPGAKQVFSRIGSQIALALLDAYPTPESAARLGEARLAAFCRRHSYRGGRSPAELLGRLRSAPAAPVGLAPEVLAELVGAQVRLLRILLATIAELDRALGAGLLGHAKAGLLAPLPRIGEVSLAQVIAEVGPILDRASTVEHATAECGAAPVTKASGKSKAVTFRWAANTKARNALATFAGNSRHSSPWAAKVYADTRRRGKHHPTPSASWLGPGCGSCGPAGTTTPSTTPPDTAQNGGSPPEVDSGNSSATSPARCSRRYGRSTSIRPPRLDMYRSVTTRVSPGRS
jgi:transposase